MTSLALVFTSSSALISRTIRFFTRSRTSHTAIGLELFGTPFFLHATVGGIQMTPRARWLKTNRVVAEFKIVPDLSAGLQDALHHIGDAYDYVGLLGFLLVLTAKKLGRTRRNLFASPSAMVCSELALHLDLTGSKIPEWRGLDPERTSPEDLLRICEQSAQFQRVNDARPA